MEKDCSAAPLFVEDLLVHVLNENKVRFRYCRQYLGSSSKTFKPVFTPEIGKVISHFCSKYKADYQPIFDNIFDKMQRRPASSSYILLSAVQRLADSLLYDRDNPKMFFMFCAIFSEMFLQSFRKGYRVLMSDVVRETSFLIDEKLQWSEDGDLGRYEAFLKDFKVDGI